MGDFVITGSTISAPSNADITITNSGTGAVNVDSNKIINLGTPTADTDAATKVYVDDSVAAVSTTSIAQLNSSVAVTDSGTNGTITVSADGNTELVINDTSATFSGQLVANNALSVTGNITVTGTVDGRDVATDGTKLDGIESAATADQSASEILTAIKTVDGTGSGLDADTLDGVEASALATLTGTETLTNKTLSSPSVTGNIDVTGTVYTDSIMSSSSNQDITLDPSGTGGVVVNGAFSATTKSFDIEHPTKPGHRLRYGVLEGPEHAVYVRGRLTGVNSFELPDHWTGLVDDTTITVQLTAIGERQSLRVGSIQDNTVTVVNDVDANIDCYYFVQATRKDTARLETEYEG